MGYRATLGPLEVMDVKGHALAEPVCRCGCIDRVTKCSRNGSMDGCLSRSSQDCQYTLRRTAALRGATTAPAGRTTGRATTAAPTVAPPAATQPARTTPRAQTTALASMVLKAMKLPASNRGIIRCFMTALLGLLVQRSVNRNFLVGRFGTEPPRPRRRLPVSSQARFADRGSGSRADGLPHSM